MMSTTRLPRCTTAGIAIVLVLVLAACDGGTASTALRAGATADSVEQVLFGARTVLAADGARRGEVVGTLVRVYDAATRFEFEQMRARFLTPSGRPLSELSAIAGVYTVNTRTLLARGAVTVVSDTSGRRLESHDVRYDPVMNLLQSDSAFSATAGARTLTGKGFTADPGLFTVTCVAECNGSLR